MLAIDGIIFSLQRQGGISVYSRELISRLLHSHREFRTLLYDQSAPELDSTPVVRQPSRLAERYRPCRVPSTTSVFHSTYYRLPSRPMQVVTTVHDFTYERFVKGPRRWLHGWQKASAIRASQAIICISENTRRDLNDYIPGIPAERIRVIPNGVSECFYPIPTGRQADARPYVLFVGARGGYKNFDVVVRAVRRLPDIALICVGGGALTDMEKESIKALADRFCLKLDVSQPALNTLYNEATCLAYPSLYEGFGIPVLEAMKAGCPVIAMNRSSIPEVAGDAAILLDSSDEVAFASAIERTTGHAERISMRQKGLKQAAGFSWEDCAHSTFRIYDELLA